MDLQDVKQLVHTELIQRSMNVRVQHATQLASAYRAKHDTYAHDTMGYHKRLPYT